MKQLVFFPTYNEAKNVASMLERIVRAVPEADILIVDDNSPDSTSDVTATCGINNLKTLIRPRKLGIGTAHLLAWHYALHHGYDTLVTTDGDHSHDPGEIPMLLARLNEGNDLVIGSRYIKGGLCDYPWYRKRLSQTANATIRRLLQIKLSEFTTSFRAFRVNKLLALNFTGLAGKGYSFFFLAMAEAYVRGLRIAEVPIHVYNRKAGASKLTAVELLRSAQDLSRLAVARFLHKTTINFRNEHRQCLVCGCEYSRMILRTATSSKGADDHQRLMEFCLFCDDRKIAGESEALHAFRGLDSDPQRNNCIR